MNRFVIVTFDMDGSMVTFEGSRFTETQQAAIFHMVERAGKEPVSPGEKVLEEWSREDPAVSSAVTIETAAFKRSVFGDAPVTASADQYAQRDLKRAEAKAGGYTGEPCPTCHGFKTRRNGSCLLCEDCKSTTGCS